MATNNTYANVYVLRIEWLNIYVKASCKRTLQCLLPRIEENFISAMLALTFCVLCLILVLREILYTG